MMRRDPRVASPTMAAVLLTGHGGLDRLEYRTDVPVPRPGRGEVLIRVAAAGINNTDVNTRIGWYSKAVDQDTDAGGTAGFETVDEVDATWSGKALEFPRIQGADVCGQAAGRVAHLPAGADRRGPDGLPHQAAPGQARPRPDRRRDLDVRSPAAPATRAPRAGARARRSLGVR